MTSQTCGTFFCKVLSHRGHQVVAVAEDSAELIRLCREKCPDLIVTDIVMPEIDGLEALEEICRENPIPAILVSAHNDDHFIGRAKHSQMLAYMVKPIKKDDLEPMIKLAMQRFKEFQALHQQADDLRQALEDRKTIERAKGVLMKRAGLDEPDAFRRLQKLSSERIQKMVELARTIIEAEQAFQP